MTFYIKKVKGQLHCDIILCKNTFLAVILSYNPATEEDIVTIFHISSDTELVTLILELRWLYRSSVLLGWRYMCGKNPRFWIRSFFAAKWCHYYKYSRKQTTKLKKKLFYLYIPISQIKHLPQGASQSVQQTSIFRDSTRMRNNAIY